MGTLFVGALIGLGAGILSGGLVLIIVLPLPRLRCPDCGDLFPRFRMPANRRQALWGGATCARCGCEVDRKGRKMQPHG